jgi:hypothetical protein
LDQRNGAPVEPCGLLSGSRRSLNASQAGFRGAFAQASSLVSRGVADSRRTAAST